MEELTLEFLWYLYCPLGLQESSHSVPRFLAESRLLAVGNPRKRAFFMLSVMQHKPTTGCFFLLLSEIKSSIMAYYNTGPHIILHLHGQLFSQLTFFIVILWMEGTAVVKAVLSVGLTLPPLFRFVVAIFLLLLLFLILTALCISYTIVKSIV